MTSSSILAVRSSHGSERLWAVNPATGAMQRLRSPLSLATSDSGVFAATNPSWSPDSKFIAFRRDDFALFVVNRAGRGLRRLGDAPDGWNWSHTGDLLAFSDDNKGSDAIWITQKTEAPRMIVEVGSNPQWRADGMILFTEQESYKLLAVKPDGTSVTPIGAVVGWWRVSPDRRHILFNDFSDFSGAAVMDAWGNDRRSIDAHDFLTSAWAPDSRRLAFTDSATRLRLFDLRTGRSHSLLRHPIRVKNHLAAIDSISWSPDGRALALDMSVGLGPPESKAFFEEIWVLHPGGAPRRLVRGLQLSQWQPSSRVEPWIAP